MSRKPKLLKEDYEITLVQSPPPGPPEYELVNAWPSSPRSIKYNRQSRVPIIISSIALIIAIIALVMSPLVSQYVSGLQAATQTVTVTATRYTITTERTTRMETIIATQIKTHYYQLILAELPICNFTINQNLGEIRVRFLNMSLKERNGIRFFLFNITITKTIGTPIGGITENDFTIKYRTINQRLMTDVKIVKVNMTQAGPIYRVNASLPMDPVEIYIYFRGCLIGTFHG